MIPVLVTGAVLPTSLTSLTHITSVAFSWGGNIDMVFSRDAGVFIYLFTLSGLDRGLILDNYWHWTFLLSLILTIYLFDNRSGCACECLIFEFLQVIGIYNVFTVNSWFVRFWVSGGVWDWAKDIDIVYIIMILSALIALFLRHILIIRRYIAVILDICCRYDRSLFLYRSWLVQLDLHVIFNKLVICWI